MLKTWKPSFKKGVPFSMILCGSRRSGKSYFIRSMWSKHWRKCFDVVIIFSNSLTANDFYAEFIPGELQFNEYKPEVLEAVFTEAEKKPWFNKKPINYLVLFDDCVSVRQKYDDSILQSFTRGRHSNVSVIFATQTATLVDSNWRENVDYMVIFKQKTGQKKEHVRDSFLMGLIEEDQLNGRKERDFLIELMRRECVNHKAIVIDYLNEEDDFYKYVFSFKAP